MANRKKGLRKTTVNGCSYAWYVTDSSDGEGFWTLLITSDDDWQKRIVYPLTETELQRLAKKEMAIPLPEQFDRMSGCLTESTTTDIGDDRHVSATPKLVRMLVTWYCDNVWNVQ